MAGIKILRRDKRVQRAANLAGQELRATSERGLTVITVSQLEQSELVTLASG